MTDPLVAVQVLPLLVRYALLSLGGLIILLVPFAKRWRNRPLWSRFALWLFGGAGITWSFLGFVVTSNVIPLSRVTVAILFTIRHMLTGLAGGQLLLLVLAGGFSGLSSKTEDTDKKSSEERS